MKNWINPVSETPEKVSFPSWKSFLEYIKRYKLATTNFETRIDPETAFNNILWRYISEVELKNGDSITMNDHIWARNSTVTHCNSEGEDLFHDYCAQLHEEDPDLSWWRMEIPTYLEKLWMSTSDIKTAKWTTVSWRVLSYNTETELCKFDCGGTPSLEFVTEDLSYLLEASENVVRGSVQNNSKTDINMKCAKVSWIKKAELMALMD